MNMKIVKKEVSRKSTSKTKNQRLSSKSLHKALSPNGFGSKLKMKTNSKLNI